MHMKRIINGKRYDTSKAQLLGEYSEGSRSDFERWQAGLYKTPRSGQYFLAGEGGPMSGFAQPAHGGGMTGGEKIIPMSESDALAWAEEYLTEDEIEEHFAHLIEDA